MSRQTAIRFPDGIYQRLQALAEKTGRTASFYIREANGRLQISMQQVGSTGVSAVL